MLLEGGYLSCCVLLGGVGVGGQLFLAGCIVVLGSFGCCLFWYQEYTCQLDFVCIVYVNFFLNVVLLLLNCC